MSDIHDGLAPPGLTIAPPPEPANLRLIKWVRSNAEPHTAPLELLLDTLRAELEPRFLRNVLQEVGDGAGLLASWREAGVNTFGLASIAELVHSRPGLLQTAGFPRRTEHPVSADFASDTGHLYLCKMLSARHSYLNANNPAQQTWSRRWRLWILVQAMDRARHGNIQDQLLREVCDSTRKASEESSGQDWLRATNLLVTPQDGFDEIGLHLAFTATRLISTADERELAPKHLKFLKALLGVVRGRSEPDKTGHLTTTGQDPARYCLANDFEDGPDQIAGSDDDDVEPVSFSPVLTGVGKEDDDDHDVVLLASDPQASTQRQERHANRIHLLLGAQARYVVWGWQKPNPVELTELLDLIETTYRTGDEVEQLLAATVEISLNLGMSLSRAMKAVCGHSIKPTEQWSIDLTTMTAVKQPPRRPAHWSPNEANAEFVQPAADSISVPLTANCRRVLTMASAKAHHFQTINDLWPQRVGTVLERFGKWVHTRSVLTRLGPSMLAGWLGQRIYDQSGDSVFAALFSASEYKGLPASAAYAAYRTTDLATRIAPSFAEPERNVGGSRLDPTTEFLRDGFRLLHASLVTAAQGSDPLEFHNLLTVHWDAVFRATTAIRPNSEIWKSIKMFDWAEGFALLDEKLSPLQSSARLVPILDEVAGRFRQDYLSNHLPALAQWLSNAGHPDIAQTVKLLAEGGEGSLPGFLFQLVGTRGTIEARPVDGELRATYRSPGYPLPWNVFRHWLRTQCHRLGLNVELIDSFIGHSDGATLTHGDYSERVWLDDAQAVRKKIAVAHASLEIAQPPPFEWLRVGMKPNVISPQRPDSGCGAADDCLGARDEDRGASNRWRLRLKAARQARRAITLFLIANRSEDAQLDLHPTTFELARALSNLAPEKTSELSARLIRTGSGAPELLGPLRYSYLLWLVQRAWDRHGYHIKLSRRYHLVQTDRSPFNRDIVGSAARFDALRHEVDTLFLRVTPSKLSKIQALCLAALDISVSTRSADKALLERLMSRDGFRILTTNSKWYMEWNQEEAFEDGQAVQRLRISHRTARLLHDIKSAGKSICQLQSPVPSLFASIANCVTSVSGDIPARSVGDFFTAVCRLTDQRNVIELPGSIAALLGGRVRSASLPWQDWLAVKDNRRVTWSPPKFDQGTPNDDDHVSDSSTRDAVRGGLPTSVKRQVCANIEARAKTRELLTEVRKHLNQFVERGLERPPEPNERRTLAAELERAIRKYETLVPPAMCMLCWWSVALFNRNYTKRRKLLAISSIRRYFDALVSKFAALVDSEDLREMSPQEIVDFYSDVLSIRSPEKSIYVYRRLKEFHQFAASQFHVPTIDWGEIIVEDGERLCSPGYLDEARYLQILQYIASDSSLSHRVGTCTRALAIFAYRFGLREEEAMGLFRDDWVITEHLQFVIVRRDTLRGLKTTAARRQVPLLFNLSKLESRVLEDLKVQWNEFSKGSKESPLFCDPQEPDKVVEATFIYRYLNAAIQTVSGAEHLSIHKLRHSFAARVWNALQTHQKIESVAWQLDRSDTQLRIRRILLGRNDLHQPTRRAPWCLAALLGHSHPQHAIFSYVHLLSDVAEELAFKEASQDWEGPDDSSLTDLDALPSHSFNCAVPTASTTIKAALPRDVLDIAGMLSDGIQPKVIEAALKLPGSLISTVALVLAAVDARLNLHARAGKPNKRRKPKSAVTAASQASKAETLSARPMPRARSGSTGILAHVLLSDRPVIAKVLDELSSVGSSMATYSNLAISLDEFVGMFGPRRLVSLWTQAQFTFVTQLVTDLGLKAGSVRLGAPEKLNPVVRRFGENVGLISSDQAIGPARGYSLPIDKTVRLDRTSFGDPPRIVVDRVSLALMENVNSHVKDRYQLILHLVCVYCIAIGQKPAKAD